MAAVVLLLVVAWDSTAYALNSVVSQDLPILTKIAALEAKSLLELGGILKQTQAAVAQAREYTDLAKTVYYGIDDLRHLTWDQLKTGVMAGLKQSFPEVAAMYEDARDIADLRRPDWRSVETVRGMLWEHVYGPAIDGMHGVAHGNLDALARSREQRARQSALTEAAQKELEAFVLECARGEGACLAAATRAQIKQTQLLADLQRTASMGVELLERERITADAQAAQEVAKREFWIWDFQKALHETLGTTPPDAACQPGSCLYERYGGARSKVLSDYLTRHPEAGGIP